MASQRDLTVQSNRSPSVVVNTACTDGPACMADAEGLECPAAVVEPTAVVIQLFRVTLDRTMNDRTTAARGCVKAYAMVTTTI